VREAAGDAPFPLRARVPVDPDQSGAVLVQREYGDPRFAGGLDDPQVGALTPVREPD
jgi:hypothetical protein